MLLDTIKVCWYFSYLLSLFPKKLNGGPDVKISGMVASWFRLIGRSVLQRLANWQHHTWLTFVVISFLLGFASTASALPVVQNGSLKQYDFLGNEIQFGGQTLDGVSRPVVLVFQISNDNPASEITPLVEVRPITDPFSGYATHNGATQAGATVTARVYVEGLRPGQQYKWQAWVSTAAAESAKVALGDQANPAFIVATPYKRAHGLFTENDNTCTFCHGVHSSNSLLDWSTFGQVLNQPLAAGALIKAPQPAQLCMTCHDGTASVYNVLGHFQAPPGSAGPSVHPVKATGSEVPAPSEANMHCTTCHNPHGDRKPSGSEAYPMLLRYFDASGKPVYEGPEYCLTCHGPQDRGWGGAYYNATGGDHSGDQALNVGPSHYQTDTVNNAVYSRNLPLSGSKVTCLQCHAKHTGSGRWLLPPPSLRNDKGLPANAEEDVCFVCHNTPATSKNLRNILAEFRLNGTAPDAYGRSGPSRHDIYSETGAKVECSSCHGPHTATADNPLADPFNTKVGFTAPMTSFCLRCHGNSVPAETRTANTVVPYSIIFPSWQFSTNPSGFNKAGFINSAHDNNNIGCSTCHAPHSSQNPRLAISAEDAASGQGSCLGCHGGIAQELQKGSRHPVLDYNGRHSDREAYGDMSVADRHAECADCHDPHAATPSSPTLNVSGVDYNSGTSQFTFQNPAGNVNQICLKCHSSFSWGTQQAPSVPSEVYGTPQHDSAQVFSVLNPSYHPVLGSSNANIRAAAFVPGYSSGMLIRCTDCHGSDNASQGSRGPHGSNYPFLLELPVKRAGEPGTVGNQELCFKCHLADVYLNGAKGSGGEPLSRFYGTVNGVAGISLHWYHLTDLPQMQGWEINCQSCHTSHGTVSAYSAENCTTLANCVYGADRLLAFRSWAQDQADPMTSPAIADVGPDQGAGAPRTCVSGCHVDPNNTAKYQWTPAY